MPHETPSPGSGLRILVADDHEVVRRGIRSIIAAQAGWELCEEAVDGVDAVEKARVCRADVILLDVTMPRMNGLEAARVIKSEMPQSEILILSQHDPAQLRPLAEQAGARAFLSKSDIARDLVAAIDAVSRHEKPQVKPSPHAEVAAPFQPKDRRMDCLAGGGQMGALTRAFDWASHPLGAVPNWPQSLQTAISICLESRFPILIWWGADLFMLYNDAYSSILGSVKHPRALGQRGAECWPEI
jgi:DNA-binding NarL/FixJ family response regulator